MTAEIHEPLVEIPIPTIVQLSITTKSEPVILEPYHVDLLPVYNYVTREYLLSGEAAGQPYCTRVLLRCPKDVKVFSGIVVAEPAHIWSGTSVWRACNRWIMRNGHAWIEVDSQAPVAVGIVKGSDSIRYSKIDFPEGPLAKDFQENIPFTPNPTRKTLENEYTEFMKKWWKATPQSSEILTATSWALRSGELGLSAKKVILSGLSQTGGVTRRFITHGSHLRLPGGDNPFEAFIPCASGGAALPDLGNGIKIMELVGEAEFQSTRWSCGVSGQMRGTTHRRPDSECFRLYEVAGMAHRESRYSSALDVERFAKCDLGGAIWSSFPNSFLYAAVFEAMVDWMTGDRTPPSSVYLTTVDDTDVIARDEHGNALGGVRTLYVDVPVSKVVAATPMGRPSWYRGTEWIFGTEKLRQIYGDDSEYKSRAGLAIESQIQSGFLLPCDAEVLRRETVEPVRF